jgi:hypothetical protein
MVRRVVDSVSAFHPPGRSTAALPYVPGMANDHPARVRCSLSLNPYGVEKLRQVGAAQLVPEWALTRLVDAAIAHYVADHWRPDMARVDPVELAPVAVPQPEEPVVVEPVVVAELATAVEPGPDVHPGERGGEDNAQSEPVTPPLPVANHQADARPAAVRPALPPEWLEARALPADEDEAIRDLHGRVDSRKGVSLTSLAKLAAKSPYPSIRQVARYICSLERTPSRAVQKRVIRRTIHGKPMLTPCLARHYRPRRAE